MTISTSQNPDKLASSIVENLNATNVIETIDASGGTLYSVYIDNTRNPNFPCYLKMFSGPEHADTGTYKTLTESLCAGGGVRATATVVCHADIATSEYITLISATGVTKTYTAHGSEITSDTNNMRFDASGDAAATATSLENVIEHANGHNGAILVSKSTATLTLTQLSRTTFADSGQAAGSAGNTAITETFNASATVPAAFTGGVDYSLATSGTQEPNWIFPCSQGAVIEYHFPNGIAYADTLRACVVNTPGKAGTSTMTNLVAYRLGASV
tara:strand:- start:278 stop:1093 length:816 start_codon:yes stop_codon:yes gene_type:complete